MAGMVGTGGSVSHGNSFNGTWGERSWVATAALCGSALTAIVFSYVAFWRDTNVSVAVLLLLLAAPMIGRWPLSWQRALVAGICWLVLGFPMAYLVGFGLALAGVLLIIAVPVAFAVDPAVRRGVKSA